MAKVTTTNKVRIVVFNKLVVEKFFAGNSRICWKTEKSGTIVRRGEKGRFSSIPFACISK